MSAQRVRVVGDLYHGSVPAGAVYVGRPSPGLPGSAYQNRHRVGDCRTCGATHADQASAVVAFAHDLDDDPGLVDDARRDLASRDLACWCKKPPCHGDLLLLVAAGAAPRDALRQIADE